MASDWLAATLPAHKKAILENYHSLPAIAEVKRVSNANIRGSFTERDLLYQNFD